MNDAVFLRGLEVDCILGVYDRERTEPQRVIIDLDLECDVARAAAHDELVNAVDWSAVTRAIRESVAGSSFRLVETLASNVADLLLAEFDVTRVRVRIRKPAAATFATAVGVEIWRDRRGG